MKHKPIIYLLRHGEIELGGELRFVGQVDLPLTGLGIRQAEWWREKLASKDFGQVYCSDLSRCRHTAELVMEGRDISIQPTPQFREITPGPEPVAPGGYQTWG